MWGSVHVNNLIFLAACKVAQRENCSLTRKLEKIMSFAPLSSAYKLTKRFWLTLCLVPRCCTVAVFCYLACSEEKPKTKASYMTYCIWLKNIFDHDIINLYLHRKTLHGSFLNLHLKMLSCYSFLSTMIKCFFCLLFFFVVCDSNLIVCNLKLTFSWESFAALAAIQCIF